MEVPADPAGLETTLCARLLQERWILVVQRHEADLQRSEAQLQVALKELELMRQQAGRELEQRTAQLRREHDGAMAALERRFLTEAEALQARLRECVQREAERCQAGIDARAKELLVGLEHSSSGSKVCSVISAVPGTGVAAAGQRSPVRPSPARTPAMVAASEAIAALRLRLPPSPDKLRHHSSQRPVFNLTAASGTSAPTAPYPLPPTCRPNSSAGAGAASPQNPGGLQCGPGLPVASPGMPNTAAAMRSKLMQPPTSLAGGGMVANSGRVPPSKRQPTGTAPANEQGSSKGWRAVGTCYPLPHESSSEFEDDGYIDGDDHSSEEGLDTSRPPPVKLINPSRALPGQASGGSPRPSSSRQVHVNFAAGDGSPRAAARRSYSPCACREGQLGLRSPTGSSGLLRGADDFSL